MRPTTCDACAPCCPFTAEVEGDRVVRLNGPECHRGAAQLDLLHHPDRLLHPLRRTRSGFQRISWDDDPRRQPR